MKLRPFNILCVAAMAMGGCAVHRTQRVPTLTGTPAPAPDPKPNFVQQVGDTTWNVVSAPARLVAPKKPESREPVTYEAPTATITRRSYDEDEPAPATPPSPAPPANTPASRP